MAHAAAELPELKTVHRRFQTWCRDAVLRRVLTDVANELRDRGSLNEEECFIDATFVMAKGGGLEIGATKRGKGMKIMAIVDRHGLPLSVSTHAANHHEVRLVQLCFAGVVASPAARWLGVEMDRFGRVKVNPDLSIPGHPNIFAIGDTAQVVAYSRNLIGVKTRAPGPLPGVAQPAIQEGRYVADLIRRRVLGRARPDPFWYWDKGDLGNRRRGPYQRRVGTFGGSLCTSSGHSSSTSSRISSETSERPSISSRNLCSRSKSSCTMMWSETSRGA